MTDEWTAGIFWAHIEGRHVQGPGTASLYPANTEHGEVGGQRFKGHGLMVRRGEKSILRFQFKLFQGSVLLEWLTTQKK